MTTNFLAPAVTLLTMSLLVTVLQPHDPSIGIRVMALVGWVAQASFWLGIVLVAAHLGQELLRERSS